MGRSILALAAFVAIAFAVAAFGSIATIQNVEGWYASADKAFWTPPNVLFGPVWTVLYLLMSVAAWLVWREHARGVAGGRRALIAYVVQLIINAIWTPVFFGLYPLIGVSALWIGLAIIVALDIAVLVTMRVLGAEGSARRAAPFLVFGPAAIWQSVSADAMFAAVAAWGMAALALGAVRRSWPWSVVAGLLLGYCVMLSYGLPLLGVLAVAVLVAARSSYPLVFAILAACAVVLSFAVAGFAWWEAYPALHDRYWAGVGGRRPPAYWIWGNLAALLFSAGPFLGAGVAQLLGRGRGHLQDARTRVAALLSGAGVVMVLLADLSQMSKAEVERIWLPFVPWLLVSCSLLPERWRRAGVAIQVLVALAVPRRAQPAPPAADGPKRQQICGTLPESATWLWKIRPAPRRPGKRSTWSVMRAPAESMNQKTGIS